MSSSADSEVDVKFLHGATGMGFTKQEARAAFKEANGDAEAAMQKLVHS